MTVFNTHPKLKNGKRRDTIANNRMTAISTSGTSDILNNHRGNTDSDSEARIMTQEEVNEQIKNYTANLTVQLEDLTRLRQGMSRTHQKNVSQSASTCSNSSATGMSSDRDILYKMSNVLNDYRIVIFRWMQDTGKHLLQGSTEMVESTWTGEETKF